MKLNEYSSDLSNYQSYGANAPLDIKEADPVQCALDGPDGVNNMFACAGNPRRRQIGLTEAMMAQRCSKNGVSSWDGYCTLYGQQLASSDHTGKAFHAWIKDTLSRMFCQNDTSIPGAQCIERCEQYNPTSSSSVSVCMTQGDLVYRASDIPQAINTVFPQTGKLTVPEPIRFTKCPKVCNLFNAETLSDQNIPLNIALDYGIAMDLITNLIENIVAAGKQSIVTNSRLKKMMQHYVMDGTVKPGYSNVGQGPYRSATPIAVPAVNPVIVPDVTYVVNPSGMNELVSATNVGTSMRPARPIMNETFDYIPLGETNSSRDHNLLWAILLISVLAIMALCIAKKMRKM
jgi:hypothetical protein